MLEQIKYSILRTVRNKEQMIMSLVISIAMGTIMVFMTSSILDELEAGTLEISVAVVMEAESEHIAFVEVLEGAGDLFDVQFLEMEKALYELENENIEGIFEIGNTLRLLVTQDHFPQLLLQMMADEYLQYGNAFAMIANEHPSYLEAAILRMMEEAGIMYEMDLAATMADPTQNMIIFLVSLVSVLSYTPGFENALKINNDAGIGSRRIVSSFGKMKMLVGDLIGGALVQIGLTFVAWGYFEFVLGYSLGLPVHFAALAFIIVSLFGVAFGAFFGLVAPGQKKTREQALNGTFMVLSILGGFGAQMRGIAMIDAINQINPIILIQDAMLALTIDNMPRYVGIIGTALVVTVVLFVITLMTLRRNRHVDVN